MSKQIFNKTQYGDFQTLGRCLGTSADAAKQRFYRGDIKATDFLERIIENRENLIKELQDDKE